MLIRGSFEVAPDAKSRPQSKPEAQAKERLATRSPSLALQASMALFPLFPQAKNAPQLKKQQQASARCYPEACSGIIPFSFTGNRNGDKRDGGDDSN
jgi:hypothetical protein